jgi:hypothetical protein
MPTRTTFRCFSSSYSVISYHQAPAGKGTVYWEMTSILGGSGGGASAVPTLVPKPGSSTVTQEHLPARKSGALPALGLFWVMLDSEICSLKIRMSVDNCREQNLCSFFRFSPSRTPDEVFSGFYCFAGHSDPRLPSWP